MDTADVAESKDKKYAQIDVRYSDIHIGRSNERPEVVNGDNAKPPFEIESGKDGNVKHHKVADDTKKMYRVRKDSNGEVITEEIPESNATEIRQSRGISMNKVPAIKVKPKAKPAKDSEARE